ncbi:MAG: outer membrane beta-barrel protein [Opitutales bacterium]|jgi:hypothetical protein
MKSLTKLSLALAPMLGAFVSSQAAPVISLGDEMALHITGQASIRSESNVLLRSSNTKSDVAYQYTPGIELDIGSVGITDFNGRVSYRYHIIDYQDISDLDTNNNDFTSTFVYKNASLKATAALSYVELQTNTDVDYLDGSGLYSLQPGMVSRSVVNVSGYAEMSVSAKTKIGTGISYDGQNYISGSGYSDFTSFSVPFDVYTAISPKTDVSIGYVYRPVSIGESSEVAAIDHKLSLGLRGELMPKLTGYASFGWIKRDARGAGVASKSGLSFNARLNYALSPLVDVGVRLMRDYSVSPISANTTTRTGLIFVGDYKIGRSFRAGAIMGYVKTEYLDFAGRTDDYLLAGVSMSYQPNEYLNVKASYTHNNNESSMANLDYGNNILEVVASLRY